MRVIITGGTGLIGRSLVTLLARQDYEIIVLSRNPALAAQMCSRARRSRECGNPVLDCASDQRERECGNPVSASSPGRRLASGCWQRQGLKTIRAVGWDARTAQGWGELITGESAIVNLAGASPAHWRWTPAYRARILESRLRAGAAVMQAIERCGPPGVLLQASAAGYYGDQGQQIVTELSPPGQCFRAEVCQAWEASTAQATTRRCILRAGIVLDTHAGAFPPLLRFARMLGSRLGDGQQWIPWIHREDVARAIQFLIEQPALSGPFNLCAPEPATNRDFIHTVQRVLKRFPVFPLPALALRVLLGELSTVMLDSQRMLPQRLIEAGFQFDYPQLEQALRHLLRGEAC